MDAHDFARWLQGFAELSEGAPTQAQWDSIKERLHLVFPVSTTPPPAPVVQASPLTGMVATGLDLAGKPLS